VDDPQPDPLRDRKERHPVDARPPRRVGERAGTEGRQVPAQQALQPFVLGDLHRPQPLGREAEQICAAMLPGSRWRPPNELDPGSGPDRRALLAKQSIELLPVPRPSGELAPELGGDCVEVDASVLAAVRAEPPLLTRWPDPGGEVPVVARRDDVDGRAHERPLHCTPPLERTREIAEREALEHRPETDVRRRGVLGLQTGDPLERAPDRDPGAGEKELAGEDSAVERPRREDHGRTAALR
jgi:hypothetical protein